MDIHLQALLDTTRRFLTPLRFDPPVKLPREVENLIQKFDMEPRAPESIQLDQMRQRVHAAYAERDADCIHQLSGRERRWLPWLMYYGDPPIPIEWPGFLRAALDDFVASSRLSRLGGWIQVYLKHYKPDNPHTEELRKFIHNALVNYNGSLDRLLCWKRRTTLLFTAEPLTKTVQWIFGEQKSVSECLQNLGFEGDLTTCQFLDALTQKMIIYGEQHFPRNLDRILTLLEIPGDRGPQPRSRDLVRMVASRFLPRAGVQAPDNIQSQLRPVLLRHLRDPRFPGGETRWEGVPQEAKRIFNLWLSQKDIEFFFDLVSRSRSNSETKWQYRRAFWEAYVHAIEMTWVVLGSQALHLAITPQMQAHMKDRGCGRLQGTEADQSIFLIRMGGYDFVEWSHIGACRVWPEGEAPFEFGKPFYKTYEFRRDTYCHKISHIGSERYSWQDGLAKWILLNARIRPSQSYRLRR